ncbi:MAG: hypothetical protein Q4D79_14485 [Propionibacteriaceae bacterium]|nr:hypothetical protein [Propionibacteriaceae bacterium]
MAPDEADERLNTPFYLQHLDAGGYEGPRPAESFEQLHSQQAKASLTRLELVLGTAVLAAARLAILIREAWIFTQAMLPALRLVADSG